MRLADGRELAWLEWGDRTGSPVLMFHGTPGTRRQLLLLTDCGGLPDGVRFISPDRPGYGLSSFHPGRTFSDWARDVAQLAGHLGIDRFSVLGVSGGGPHALACAAILPERVRAAALVSSVAPPAADRMSKQRISAGDRLMAEVQVYVSAHWPRWALKLLAKSKPGPDGEIFARPEVETAFIEDSASPARTTARAMLQDSKLETSDWGLDLGSITVPIQIWHGALDPTIPVESARALAAAIPTAEFRMLEGVGHLLVVDHGGDVVRALVAA